MLAAALFGKPSTRRQLSTVSRQSEVLLITYVRYSTYLLSCPDVCVQTGVGGYAFIFSIGLCFDLALCRLVLGGGFGWLSGAHGLAIDNLVQVP